MYYKPDTGQTFADHGAIRSGLKNVMFTETITDEDLSARNVFPVQPTTKPVETPTNLVSEGVPVFESGVWKQTWTVTAATQAQLDAKVLGLAAAKLAKDLEINTRRDAANTSSFPYSGKQIAVDDLSMRDILVSAGYVALFGALHPEWPGGWICTDKSYVAIATVSTFKDFYKAMNDQGIANFNHSRTLKTALAAAATVEEVNAIVW